MKKSIAILLALTLILALCACGQQDVGGTVTAPEPKASAAAEESAPEEAAPEEPAQEEPAQEEVIPEEEPALQVGSQNGGRYENSFLGIGCELGEDWVFASQEELVELAGLTAEAFDDETFRKQMENIDMFYDLYAQREDGLATVNVVIQNLGLIYGTVIDEERYLDLSFGQLEEQLASAGFSDVRWEKNTLDFAGRECQGLKVSATIQGIAYYTQQAYLKVGNYMAVVTLATFLEDNAAELADSFFALD